MQFSRRVRPSILAASLAASLLAASAFSANAQVTGQPVPAASSSTDVQTAQVETAKSPDKRDVAVSGFGQLTNKTNGNFVRIDPTSSGGVMVSYRQSPRWWFGYELNYGNTSYSDTYDKGEYTVSHDSNEFSAAYLIKAPAYAGTRFFMSFGGGAIVLSPSSYSGTLTNGTKPSTQTSPLFVFSIGADHNIGRHFGVRFQYRDDIYKAPDFKVIQLNAHKLRSSNEPAFGVYYRF